MAGILMSPRLWTVSGGRRAVIAKKRRRSLTAPPGAEEPVQSVIGIPAFLKSPALTTDIWPGVM